jgi:crossover junction endodeoxyribonuclease RuvC
MPAMRVLGLDPGSRRTGWGVVERSGNAFRCAGHGCIVPASKLDLPRRLHHIAREAGAVIDRFAPDVVVVEEAFYHESVRSTLVLGHVRGALLVAALERGLELAEYAPRAIKLAVTGNGGASKEQVEFMVRRLLALPAVVQADAADALAGALCHLNRSRFAPSGAAVKSTRRASAAKQARALEALVARAVR